MDRADADGEDGDNHGDRRARCRRGSGRAPSRDRATASPSAASAIAADHPQWSTTSGEQDVERPRLVDPRGVVVREGQGVGARHAAGGEDLAAQPQVPGRSRVVEQPVTGRRSRQPSTKPKTTSPGPGIQAAVREPMSRSSRVVDQSVFVSVFAYRQCSSLRDRGPRSRGDRLIARRTLQSVVGTTPWRRIHLVRLRSGGDRRVTCVILKVIAHLADSGCSLAVERCRRRTPLPQFLETVEPSCENALALA